ncbi:MAG: hypothetical protein JRJ05_10035 [Deltaproteobacteria bacterium]|nr:hypothetical protein [Deltaproteobacteria bacterium]
MSRRNSLLRRYAGGGDRYEEEILEAAARESCRFNRLKACRTFFARWAYDHPQSPRLQTVLAEVRTSLGTRHANLAPNMISDMQVFFGGEFNVSKMPLAKAQALTSQFTTHYNHAVPFDEGVLETIWNHCRGPRCSAERRKIEGILGMREGGPSAFPAVKQGDATDYPASPLESSPTTLDSSPEPEYN